MNWFGWLLVFLLALAYVGNWLLSQWCHTHGIFGRCRRCEQETAMRFKAEAEAKAEAERQRRDIEETYKNMDETLRNELTAIVVGRAKREHLVIRSGDLEAAVVRIYRKPKQLTALLTQYLREQGAKRPTE